MPFGITLMGQSVLDEQQPAYFGIYSGTLANRPVLEFVESRDCVLRIGRNVRGA